MVTKVLSFPYFVALVLAHLICKIFFLRNRPYVWPRNSFSLGYFTPGVSDLDLTVWFELKPNKRELKRVRSIFRALRIFFPFLGEINLYSKDEALSFCQFANIFELSRDKLLISQLHGKLDDNRIIKQTEAAVFLFRMWDSDKKNLRTRPEKRVRKWQYHIRQINSHCTLPPVSTFAKGEGLEDRILKTILLMTNAKLSVDSVKSFSNMLTDHDNHLNEWLAAFFVNRFCYSPVYPLISDTDAINVFIQQMRWELWGLLSQYRFIERESLLGHLDHLIRCASLITNVDRHRDIETLVDGCKNLKQLVISSGN